MSSKTKEVLLNEVSATKHVVEAYLKAENENYPESELKVLRDSINSRFKALEAAIRKEL